MLIAIIITAVLIGAFIGLLAVYNKTFYSPYKNISETQIPDFLNRHPHRDTSNLRTARLARLPCEAVTVRSYDGLTLSGRYYKGKSDMPLFICFHGYRGSAIRDMHGLGLYLIDEGYNVLLTDERAHWHSGGHTITYGIRERRDVLSWIGYANSRFGTEIPIYLYGISMGGATVVMASGQTLPENVRGIISDCPYSSPKAIIKHVCAKTGLNPALCWPLIRLAALVIGRFNINAATASAEAKKTAVPILLIHGEGDDFVPTDMSREIKDANPDMVERVTGPAAGHGQSYLYEPERYQSVVKDFLQRHP